MSFTRHAFSYILSASFPHLLLRYHSIISADGFLLFEGASSSSRDAMRMLIEYFIISQAILASTSRDTRL